MTAIAERIHRIPFRLRLTLSFAAVMVVLFGGLALLLYTRFSASLSEADASKSAPVSASEGRLVRATGLSHTQRQQALERLSQLLFIGGPVTLVLTCLAGYALTGRALGPVEKMRRRAARISGDGRGNRLPVPEADDELRRLGTTLNEMLARLEEAMERERAFTAAAGHELRTPLSILKLELEDLEQAASVAAFRADLEPGLRSATEEVERLVKLAEDLLAVARAEHGALQAEKRPLAIGHLMRGVAERLGSGAGGRRVVVEPSDGLVVPADEAWLEQALSNMVSNALQHGEGRVLLKARRRRGAVELHVLDEGAGFPAALLPRAFERFTRDETARSSGGAGLGLLVVRTIAEAHGGEAGAANRENGGADVWLSLPAESR
jgi:signal transduction histidine kinase